MSTSQIIKWVQLTKTEYINLSDINESALYFLTDTKELFKGNTLFSGNVGFEKSLPTNEYATIDKLYIVENGEGYIYSETQDSQGNIIYAWKKVISSPDDEILDGVLSFNSPTSEAIKTYVAKKIKEIGTVSSIVTTEDVLVTGDIGNYKDGDIIPKGENIMNILKNQFSKRIPPVYNKPIFKLTSNPSVVNVECGTAVTPIITPTFTKNDAGDASKYTLTKIYDSLTTVAYQGVNLDPYNDSQYVIKDGSSLKYTGMVEYGEGIIKQDNLGTQDPNGHILAGSLQSSITFSGKRKSFYGTLTTKPNIDSVAVRGLSNNKLDAKDGDKLVINVSTGDTMIVIAYPSVLRDVTSIVSSALNLEVKNVFIKQLIQVEGANGFQDMEYKAFIYIPNIPFVSNDTYTITI